MQGAVEDEPNFELFKNEEDFVNAFLHADEMLTVRSIKQAIFLFYVLVNGSTL